MADVKISALPAVPVAVATTDLFAIVQGGVTYKATLTQVIAAIPDATGSTRGILSAADWTTFNSKQSALTFSTGLINAAGTVTANLSTGVSGGQSVIGGTAASNSLTLSSTSNATKGKILFGTSAYDEVNNRLGIGTAVPDRPLDVNGTARIQERLTVSQDNTVATQVVSVINTDTANCGMVIAPSGTGALMANVPDGTATGGNARGQYAVDLQLSRGNAANVANGNYSFIGGGERNTASGTHSAAFGLQNTASGVASFVSGGLQNTGFGNTASGTRSSVLGGSYNTAIAADSVILGGYGARTYLLNQITTSNAVFAAQSDNQRSIIGFSRSITGQAATELFLDNASLRAILNISSPGPTNARAWRAQVDVVAIVQTVGNGTVTLGDCFMGSYHVGIKRIGANTSLVGAVSVTNEVNDAGMAGAAVTITADDTNEALKIEFTPATNAGTTTVTRVVATAYLTEVGY